MIYDKEAVFDVDLVPGDEKVFFKDNAQSLLQMDMVSPNYGKYGLVRIFEAGQTYEDLIQYLTPNSYTEVVQNNGAWITYLAGDLLVYTRIFGTYTVEIIFYWPLKNQTLDTESIVSSFHLL